MPHNFHDVPKSDIEKDTNLRTIRRTLDSDIYFKEIQGVSFTPDPLIPGSNNQLTYPYSYHEFLVNADERAGVTFRRHERWLNGILQIRKIWYASDAAGGNFIVAPDLRSYRSTVGFATATSTATATLTIPGPTGINILTSYDCTTVNTLFVPMNTSIDYIALLIYRIGLNVSDTNAGFFKLIGVDLEYKELKNTMGENYDKPVVY